MFMFSAEPGQAGYCTPGARFKQDCNWCTCTPDGKNAMCTLIGCISKREANEETCTPGERFKKDCNWCTCLPDGKGAQCTLLGCLPARPKREGK